MFRRLPVFGKLSWFSLGGYIVNWFVNFKFRILVCFGVLKRYPVRQLIDIGILRFPSCWSEQFSLGVKTFLFLFHVLLIIFL